MTDTTREAVARATIAAILDHPTVYMGGPSKRSLQTADKILTALAALRPAQDAEGWNPIDSAPTDYTHVIGMDAKGTVAATWYFAPSTQTRNWLKVGSQGKWKPIYWMPLPSPPRTLEGK